MPADEKATCSPGSTASPESVTVAFDELIFIPVYSKFAVALLVGEIIPSMSLLSRFLSIMLFLC